MRRRSSRPRGGAGTASPRRPAASPSDGPGRPDVDELRLVLLGHQHERRLVLPLAVGGRPWGGEDEDGERGEGAERELGKHVKPPSELGGSPARRRYASGDRAVNRGRRLSDGTTTRLRVRGGIGLPMKVRAALIALVLTALLVAGPAQAALPDRDQRAGPRDVLEPGLAAARARSVRATSSRGTGRGRGSRRRSTPTCGRRAPRGQDVLVTFTAHRGCFNGRRYGRERYCRAPSARAYRAAFRRFDDRYPWVRTYAGWNEVNHISQPTFGRPRLAVRYYRVLRSERRRRDFRVLAADVLDTANLLRYLRAFRRLRPGRPRLWGLHNYQDVNRGTAGDTRRMLAQRPRRGVADGDERDREVRRQPPVPLLGGACGAPHALDVPDRRSLRRAAAAAPRRGSRGSSSTSGSARRRARASTPASSVPTALRGPPTVLQRHVRGHG